MQEQDELAGARLMFVTAIPTTARRFIAPVAAAARELGAHTILVSGADSDEVPPGFDQVHLIRAHRRRGPIRIRQAAQDLAALVRREQVDLLHLHSPFSILLGRMAAASAGVPNLAVIHGTPLDQTGLGPMLFTATERRLARRSNRIITLNDEDVDAYRRFAPDTPVELAPAGGAGIDFPQRTPVRQPRDEPVALFLGRPAPEKNLGLLEEAWRLARSAVPGLRLRIVGGPAEGERAPDPVDTPEFTWIPRDCDPLAELDDADLLVSASAREGFGMVVAEALYRGLPVASVTNRGARHIARSVESGLILTDATAPALAQGIVAALGQPVVLSDAAVRDWARSRVVDFHLDQIRLTLTGRAGRRAALTGPPPPGQIIDLRDGTPTDAPTVRLPTQQDRRR